MIGQHQRRPPRAGVAHGAAGLLVTDWGDMGHHQQPLVSDPGFATAAAFSWCADAHADLDADDLAAMLDVHCYDDPAGATGRAVVALGQTYRMVAPQPPNMSALALPVPPPPVAGGHGPPEGLTADDLDAVRGPGSTTSTAVARPGPARVVPTATWSSTRSSPPSRCSAWPAATPGCAWRGDGTLASVAPADRGRLGRELDAVPGRAPARCGCERFRPGGLDDSVAWFEHLLAPATAPATAERSWFGPFG